jgi:transcriptional regulator with XRE-family HTH domain
MVTTIGVPTGLDLRLERTARLVSQSAIARELGVSPQAISNLEARLRPTPEAIRRYRSALERVAER